MVLRRRYAQVVPQMGVQMMLRFRRTITGGKEGAQGDWFERINLSILHGDSFFFAVDTREWFLKWVFK